MDEVHCIENVFVVLNATVHEPVSPLPRRPFKLAWPPLTVPEPRVPLSQVTVTLQPLCAISHAVLVHEPLSAQRPL